MTILFHNEEIKISANTNSYIKKFLPLIAVWGAGIVIEPNQTSETLTETFHACSNTE